jgi:broad specificity phosphatase PhoE
MGDQNTLEKRGSALTNIILVRHGTTDWVDRHILHGITDIPLNENGLRQARQAAGALKGVKARALYSSPLSRCLQTANEIGAALALDPIPRDGFKELDFGWLEGKPIRDHSSQDFGPLVNLFDHYLHHFVRSVSGESIGAFEKRVNAAWDAVLEENPQGIVIVVGHSAVFNTILIRHFGRNFPPGKTYYTLHPGSFTEIQMDGDGRASLVRMDEAGHIS